MAPAELRRRKARAMLDDFTVLFETAKTLSKVEPELRSLVDEDVMQDIEFPLPPVEDYLPVPDEYADESVADF
jgi:hypothetical protein